jgi:hypothetical protein
MSKLLHYFESNPIWVVTSFGLREIIGNRLATGRIAKWALELMRLDVAHILQTAIKSQALANFVSEWTKNQQPPIQVSQEDWSLYINGSFSLNGAGGGVVLISIKGDQTRLHHSDAFPRYQ